MRNWWTYFKKARWVEPMSITESKATTDNQLSVKPITTTEDGGRFIMASACYAPGQTLLLPSAGDMWTRKAARRTLGGAIWMIESDGYRFADIQKEIEETKHTTYPIDPNTVWNMDFLDWAKAFDPSQSHVDAVVITSAPYRVAADIVAAWQFLGPGDGLTAFIPKSELVDPTDEDQYNFIKWMAEREAEYAPAEDIWVAKWHHKQNIQVLQMVRRYSMDGEAPELM